MKPLKIRKYICTETIAGAALVLCLGSNFAAAQKPAPSPERAHIEEVLKGLQRGRSIEQVAVAPDGKRLAWAEMANGGEEIRVAPLDDLKKSERVTAAAKADQLCNENEIAWSPDAKALAFFSNCAKSGGQTDLYLSRLDGHSAQRLTALNGYVDVPAFSPDGRHIAFLYVEGATRPAGALAAMKPPAGVIGEDGIEVQRIAVAEVNTAKPAAPALATPANLHVYEFDWRPDSQALAYIAAAPPGENNWWVAKLYTQELSGQPKAILAPAMLSGPLYGLQIADPQWSPDGKEIAFIGGLMSDQGSTGGDVWVVRAEGGQPRNLTPGRKTSAAWIVWGDNEHLFANEFAGGNSQLASLRVEDGQTDAVEDGAPIFNIPALVSDGRSDMVLTASADRSLFVFIASSFDRPAEIYAARPNRTKSADGAVHAENAEFAGIVQLSHLNDGVEADWGKAVSLNWKSDSFNVQGWLILPKNYDPARKYPLIVEVHGGPAWATLPHWETGGGLNPVAFSAAGYFVLRPNPRGSFGQGEAFAQANRKDFGYGDLRDILAGVDEVEAKFPIDANRVGITGWSYGGFMTIFAVTQTNRFKAAVAGAGISNWQSYYGENSIDQWMTPYFGATVYDDPAVYAKSSAIEFIKQARTPTLLVVGDRDGECPAPQSYEFWHALRDLNVPTQLVVYPNEGHGFVDPGHQQDVMERAVEWFARYMPTQE